MIIVDNELWHLKDHLGTCEECHQEKYGRMVKGTTPIMGGSPRGYFFLCFDCFKPRMYWKKSDSSIVYETPVETKDYQEALKKENKNSNNIVITQ